MGGEGGELGTWSSLRPAEVAVLLAGAPFRWWLSGGYALELHLRRTWRQHDDVDVGICRIDAPAFHADLVDAGLIPFVAARGQLRPWDGRPLSAEDDENNVWWRRTPDGPWVLDTSIGEGTPEEWIYRRDLSIRRPWDEAVLTTSTGIAYLAPELQLLFKSKDLRPKDHVDAEVAIPLLDPVRQVALASMLAPGHPWRALFPSG